MFARCSSGAALGELDRTMSLLVPDVIAGLRAVETAGSPAAAAESGDPSRTAQVVSAEFLDEFGVGADDAIAALDARLARGYALRRLLAGSKGCLGVVVAVHDRPPWRGNEHEDVASRAQLPRSNFRQAARAIIGTLPAAPRLMLYQTGSAMVNRRLIDARLNRT